jgi:D-alanine-D-alanine ligase
MKTNSQTQNPKPSNGIKKKKNNVTQILGPVENLESYVKADWWREIFNANYLRTDGDVVENTAMTEHESDLFLKILNPAKDSKILDLCCGQGRHSLELARRGFTRVTGLDRSHYLITRARNLNQKHGYNVIFKEGDARKLPFPADEYDFVIIPGNSFGYFESLQDDLKVLREVKRVLRPTGRLLIDITDGDYMRSNFQPRSWEWIDSNYFVCRERSLSGDNQRLISREVISHVKKGVIADQFYAERLYSTASIEKLLLEAGFDKITFNNELITDSVRNQDLGMMAKRILVSGNPVKGWSTKKVRKDLYHIAVLMGDPTITDRVKPNETFDEDDFHTINELKKALGSLKNYKFTFYNNHNTLIADLQKLKGKVDFIFNLLDEGYYNEARKELHVAALLEILGIPYTGGTPQCLAFCFDKSLVRGIASEMDIPVPRGFIVKPEDTTFIDFTLNFPVIVKPNMGDSSIGITQSSVCNDISSLETAIMNVREKLGYNKPILVEEFLEGKDISVGIIGNPPESYMVLPVIQEDYTALPPELPRVCGYEAKWMPDSPYWKIKSVPAGLPEETERYLVASCVKLFERLECRDYARFDWRLDDNGTPRLLEVNPNPGWCWDGHLAKMAKLDDRDYATMIDDILKAAINRLSLAERQNANRLPADIIEY